MKKITYIFKNTKLYGYISGEDLYLLDCENEILANEKWHELFDVLPEGIDLQIMINSYNMQDNKKRAAFLKKLEKNKIPIYQNPAF